MITILLYSFLALISNFFCILLISGRYKTIFTTLGETPKIFDLIGLVSVTQLISYVTPFNIGLVFGRSFLAKKFIKIQPGLTLLVTIYDQWLEIIWQLFIIFFLILLTGSKYFSTKIVLVLAVLLLFLSFLFVVFLGSVLKRVLLFKVHLPAWLKKILKKISSGQDIELVISSLKERKMFSFRLLLSLCPWILLFIFTYPLILYFTTPLLGIHLAYVDSFLIAWVSYLTGRLSGIPGGFGTRDITLAFLLTPFTSSIKEVVLLTTFYRILALFPSIIIAVFILIFTPEKIVGLFQRKTTKLI